MKKILHYVIFLPVFFVLACDVHQWPETADFVKLHLCLNYETEMTEWKHFYNNTEVIEKGYGETYSNRRDYGMIRYIVRTYPVLEKKYTTSLYTQEFVFTKDISESYDYQVTLDLLPGNYNIVVWSDLVRTSRDVHLHNTANFEHISLQGGHKGNNDYRDVFRGSNSISLVADIVEQQPDTLNIAMQRPVAKFEFVTNDVKEFIDKESVRIESIASGSKSALLDDTPTSAVNIEDYKVVFYYVGFMPNTYSISADKPVDSSTGVKFESSLKQLSKEEATMGFDYVFVDGKQSAVTVRIGIYDNDGKQLSLTEPIKVPLKRSHHTILTGMFLMSDASGGVAINPDYDGDHNIIFQ